VYAGGGDMVSSDSSYEYAFGHVGNQGIVAARSTPDCKELQASGTERSSVGYLRRPTVGRVSTNEASRNMVLGVSPGAGV
jgi:hypothetical protein